MSDTKNELETLLEKAATEPSAHRPIIFQRAAGGHRLGAGQGADGEQIVEDSALDLQHWEKRRRHLGDPILYLAGGAAAGGGG